METYRGFRDWDWSELSALYESGYTIGQLAKHYGCSVHAIQNAMKRLDVKSRRRGAKTGHQWTEEHRNNHRAAIDKPEWRAKNRENFLKRLPTMRGPSANSPLEKLLQAALQKAGIGFETQRRPAGRYVVDILINQAPVIIEADGSLHLLHKDIDDERDQLHLETGYRTFRFNGSQINRDASACIDEVIRACGLIPDENPQYVIRTGMMGSDNPNWTGGQISSTCEFCGGETPPRSTSHRTGKKFCDSKCYGAWMSVHPEESNRKLDIDWSELPSLYKSGIPGDELAKRYGVSKNTIYRHLRQMGIEPKRSRKT